jgi:hypothetical protein
VDYVHDRGHVDFIREGGREREEDSSGVDFRVAFIGSLSTAMTFWLESAARMSSSFSTTGT